MGIIAGIAAAGVALGFGQFMEGITNNPGLVLAVGEWLIDHVPGSVAKWSIEQLGTSGKGNLSEGIVVVTLLLAGWLGEISYRRTRLIGIAAFAAFGVFGAYVTARNPFSKAQSAIGWSLVAAGLGIFTLHFLVGLARRSSNEIVGSSPRITKTPAQKVTETPAQKVTETPAQKVTETPGEIAAYPVDPPHSRRAFIGWSAGAAAVAATGVGLGRLARGTSVAEQARDAVTLPLVSRPATPASTTSTTTMPAVGSKPSSAANSAFTGVNGLSPWITPNQDFYRIDTALSIPQVDPADWKLRFTGMVNNPIEFSYDELLAMPLTEHTITLSCVSNPIGGDLVGNATWTGISLVDLLDQADVRPGATQIVGRSVDDFTAGFPTKVLHDGRNAVVAVGMGGEPLPIRHGFPVRLVVAGLYGYVSATKWLSEVHLTTWEDFNGYWIDLGWSKSGPIKTTSRIDVPRSRARIEAGEAVIAGVAWAPTRGISEVEVSVDDEWVRCDLAAPGSDETWVQWRTRWNAVAGTHTLQVRARDGSGELQSPGPKDVAPDGAEGYHRVTVEVI